MLVFESKMSGTRCDGWENIVDPDKDLGLDCTGALPIANLTTVEAVEFVVERYNLRQFNPPDKERWVGTYLDCDDEFKVAIMEKHPTLKAELIKEFGDKWADHYIRFGH